MFYSVQNPRISGLEDEIHQGKTVANVAKKANVQHLAYGSSGVGVHGTGINSWESKSLIEAYMRALDLPVTVFRPMAFMELMTNQVCYPAVSTWHVIPKLMGSSRKSGWLSADDLGLSLPKSLPKLQPTLDENFNWSPMFNRSTNVGSPWRWHARSRRGRGPPCDTVNMKLAGA